MTPAALVALMIVAGVGLSSAPASAQDKKPNIVFILADNIGYGDIGVYGGGELRGAPTPRIDQLASEGLRLTQFLVEPGCTPSRAALMTGRYSIRSGLSLVADVFPGSTGADLPGGLRKAGVIHTMRRLIKETRRMKLPVRFACRPGRSRAVAFALCVVVLAYAGVSAQTDPLPPGTTAPPSGPSSNS